MGSFEINKPPQLLRSRGKNTSFVVLAQECFCLSQMTSEISHGSLLTARFRTRLLLYNLCCLSLTDVESKSSPIELRLGHDDDEDEVVDSDDEEGKHILIKSHINF